MPNLQVQMTLTNGPFPGIPKKSEVNIWDAVLISFHPKNKSSPNTNSLRKFDD